MLKLIDLTEMYFQILFAFSLKSHNFETHYEFKKCKIKSIDSLHKAQTKKNKKKLTGFEPN